jgi:hypothetical protein
MTSIDDRKRKGNRLRQRRLRQRRKEATVIQMADYAPHSRAQTGDAAATDDDISRYIDMPEIDYVRVRKDAAAALGMRVTDLDKLRKKARSGAAAGQGRPVEFPEPEPWPEYVDGAKMLTELVAMIRHHVVMPDHTADAVALWIVHTYLLDIWKITPRLGVTSPEKGCGKSTLFDLLRHLVWRPMFCANATAAAVFRIVEIKRPTMLLDESETYLPAREDLRGILNDGYRNGGGTYRVVGDNHEPRQFATYAACALACIGKLPGTLEDRSIPVVMQRKRGDIRIHPLREGHTSHLEGLARRISRWTSDNADRIAVIDPVMPTGITNRTADNWLPLLAVADAVGRERAHLGFDAPDLEWPTRARHACTTSMAVQEDQSVGVMALRDIRDIFAGAKVDKMGSEQLVRAMAQIEGRPWAEYGKTGKPISPNQLARLLEAYRVRPNSVRIGDHTPKGYQLAWFQEAFLIYLA